MGRVEGRGQIRIIRTICELDERCYHDDDGSVASCGTLSRMLAWAVRRVFGRKLNGGANAISEKVGIDITSLGRQRQAEHSNHKVQHETNF